MNKHVFWIASYPKSGNTLLRSIISSLFFSSKGNFDFKLLRNIPVIEDTINLNFLKNKNLGDYNNIHKAEIISKYWLDIQQKENLKFEGDFMFAKTHHGLIKFGDKPFTTQDFTRGYIYIIRDPRDVVISFSKHLNISVDKSIKNLINYKFALEWQDNRNLFKNKNKPFSFLSSWNHHCNSWINNDFKCPSLVIKFEDLVLKKEICIDKIINFFVHNFGFKFHNIEEKKINILETTKFDFLQRKEIDQGFIESVNNNFFSSGKINQWKDKLNKNEIEEIEKNFYPLMNKFGYKTIYY